jgi:hypothetical protein
VTEPFSLYDLVRPVRLDINDATTNIQSTIDNLHQGYTGGTTTGNDPSTLNTDVGASINGRLTVLEGAGVLTQYTASATWTKPTVDGSGVVYTANELWTIVCINGGQGGACPGQYTGAPGGLGGGYVSQQFKYSALPATAAMTIGAGTAGATTQGAAAAAGGVTSFGSLVTGVSGAGSIAKADGSYATAVPPGNGGYGGHATASGTTSTGSMVARGDSSGFASGGAPGLSANGGAGGAAPSGYPTGGGGGGGGGSTNASNTTGGAGGFPGGGGGGGGGATNPNGAGGLGAAGCIYVIAPH